MSTNAELHRRALDRIPGAVNSPVRAFRSVGGTPYFVARGEGARVWDVEGNGYIDYVQSYGASILGHARPEVVRAISGAAERGSTFGAPTEGEVVLAEMLCDRVPGMEQVRLVSSGTEAAMSVIRLARGVTGRDVIVKFDGNYHGHSDSLLAGAGSGVAEGVLLGSSAPGSAGVTSGAVADTAVVPYNVVPELDRSVAVVCVEPVAANMGLVAPVRGFLEGLRAECDRVGALLLFDEVITGFRLGVGGATAHCGVTPDLWCFGKVIGGGLPVGAFGGVQRSWGTWLRGRRVPGGHAVGQSPCHSRGSHGPRPARRRRIPAAQPNRGATRRRPGRGVRRRGCCCEVPARRAAGGSVLRRR
ncbi:MAG: aminotransferase class III-fold pyridoxal phosphate-dependent enzyme [Microthrixaceae bacterium]|nr:aminotransferase class III-fold pyridoxal phosphate-dependent enzyme [Microthrixaceae bacterium]